MERKIKTVKAVEYICSYCGRKVMQGVMSGRPTPGYCPRKTKNADGSMKPHSWRVNRKFY